MGAKRIEKDGCWVLQDMFARRLSGLEKKKTVCRFILAADMIGSSFQKFVKNAERLPFLKRNSVDFSLGDHC